MIKKIYLSRSQTRAMSLDHPIGDPTGGAAYGEKNDPISAAISIGSMFLTGAEVLAGTASLMEGLSFAGAAVSLIGNVSGNKDLMKLGMAANIVGGLGQFAEYTMGETFGKSMGETFGYGAEATNAGNAAQALGQSAVQAPVQQAAPGTAPVNAANAPSQVANAPIQNLNTGPGGMPNGIPDSATSVLVRSPGEFSPYAGTMGGPTPLGGPTPAPPGIIDQIKAGNYGQAVSQAGTNAMDALKNNPTGAYVAAQTVGAVANWLSGKTDAELDALKANTGYANAKAQEVQAALDKEKARRANLNASYGSVNAGFTVNPNAVVQQPWAQQPGLIAGARPA
jgi:hypothetical protein